jgi:membrane protein implicated in regulation of membrane protease activity
MQRYSRRAILIGTLKSFEPLADVILTIAWYIGLAILTYVFLTIIGYLTVWILKVNSSSYTLFGVISSIVIMFFIAIAKFALYLGKHFLKYVLYNIEEEAKKEEKRRKPKYV